MKILGWYFLVMGSGGGTFVGMTMVARCANNNIRAPWVNVASTPYLIVAALCAIGGYFLYAWEQNAPEGLSTAHQQVDGLISLLRPKTP